MTATLPLIMAPCGKELQVTGFRAGKNLARRLAELGFNEHSKVRVIRSDDHGALIVQLNDSRFALSRGMAMKIMVEA
jgi:ferrous iron transport protein A